MLTPMMSGNWPAFKCSIEGGNVVDGAFASCPGAKQLSPAVSSAGISCDDGSRVILLAPAPGAGGRGSFPDERVRSPWKRSSENLA